eukprot:gene42356-52526_t
MTAVLQILDLVVNGPIKKHIRDLRAQRLFEMFQTFVANECTGKSAEELKLLKFKPPHTTLKQGICDLFALFADDVKGFKTDKFKAGIVRCAKATGCIPQDNGEFVVYKETKDLSHSVLAPANTPVIQQQARPLVQPQAAAQQPNAAQQAMHHYVEADEEGAMFDESDDEEDEDD